MSVMHESLARSAEQLAEEFADLPLRTVIDIVTEQAEQAGRHGEAPDVDQVTTVARQLLTSERAQRAD